MRLLYILSGLAIFNLALVAIIASSSVPTIQSSTISSAPVVNANRCIVTIDGTRYDVTDFRNMHSGGDIFTCGSDMSAIFWNRHSQRQLNQMQQFKI